jgi:hypothetical protein
MIGSTFALLGVTALLAAVVPPGVASAKPVKVNVCHYALDTDSYRLKGVNTGQPLEALNRPGFRRGSVVCVYAGSAETV